MLQVHNFPARMGSLLKKTILAATIAMAVSTALMIIGVSLMAAAGSSGSLTIDGCKRFQTIDGFGVNANSASWKHGELRPALDLLVEQLGATIFRVVVDNADWETTNDNGDPNTFNWTFYNSVYTSPKFEDLWSTMTYLNQKGITQNLILNVMGPVASWMGGSRINSQAEDEWVEMIASFVAYARNTRSLQFGLLAPMNEPDWDGVEGPQVDQWQYPRLMQKLFQKLDALGLSSIRLVGPDTASADAGVQGYFPQMMAHPTLMAKLAQFGLHNYAGYTAHASAAIKSSAYPGKNFWMTEVTNIWDALREISQGATATLVWDGYDSVYNHAILAGRGMTPPNDAGNGPALLSYEVATGLYIPRKAFYEHLQLFRYVEPGAHRVAATVSNAAVDVLAFHHPSTNRIMIVGRNAGAESVTLDGSLTNLPAISPLQFYLTDTSSNAQRMADVPLSENAFMVTVTGGSTFTLTSTSVPPPSCL
jgi:O-glycosyl hydrolase